MSCPADYCGTGSGPITLPTDPDTNVILMARPAYGGVDVSWTYPEVNANAVAHTRLYRSMSSAPSTKVLRQIVAGNFFHDRNTSDTPILYYYWIEIVSVNGTVGPLIGPASATGRPPIQDIMLDLTGEIDSGFLAQKLKEDLGVAYGVKMEMDVLREMINGDLVERGAYFTVVTNADGLIGGFGMYNNGTIVEMGFDVDRFWVGRTGADKIKPFIIDNGTVYINDAAINRLTFSKMRSEDGSLAFTPAVYDGFGNVITPGKLKAAFIQVEQLIVDWAQIQNVEITTAQIASADIEWARIKNVQVETAQIKTAAVDTLQIKGNAITASNFLKGYYSSSPATLTFTINPGETMVFFVNMLVPASAENGGEGNSYRQFMQVTVGGAIMLSDTFVFNVGAPHAWFLGKYTHSSGAPLTVQVRAAALSVHSGYMANWFCQLMTYSGKR